MTNLVKAAQPAVLHPDTAMGIVALTVADLERSSASTPSAWASRYSRKTPARPRWDRRAAPACCC